MLYFGMKCPTLLLFSPDFLIFFFSSFSLRVQVFSAEEMFSRSSTASPSHSTPREDWGGVMTAAGGTPGPQHLLGGRD